MPCNAGKIGPTACSTCAWLTSAPCLCRASLGLQSRLLLQRSWRQIARDKATNFSRAMSNISSAIIFGSIYWRLGRSQISIQDRMGLLQVHMLCPLQTCRHVQRRNWTPEC